MSEATAPGVTMEHAVARLYSARVIDKNAVSKAVVKFKLNPQGLAKELGHDSVAELAAELVTEASAGSTETWTPFSFEEAVRVLYTDRDKKPAQLSLEMPARTPKSIAGFRYRVEKTGVRINKAVWDLLKEGYKPEEIAAVGHPLWMVEFANTIKRLQTWAIANDYEPPKVVLS